MTKSNLPNNSLTNDNLTAEAIHLTTLYNTKPRSSSGQVSFISSTSGITYTTLGSVYDNQGQEGLLQVLQLALDNYLILADDYNGLVDDISTHIGTDASTTVKGHIELATELEATSGEDDTRAVTPLGLKSVSDLLIPLSQKGVVNGVASLGTDTKLISTQLPLISATGTFADTTTSIEVGATYTKTIPLGLIGKTGSCMIYTTSNVGSTVLFNTIQSASIAMLNNHSNGAVYFSMDGLLGYATYTTYDIRLEHCYIDGTDLKMVFKNNYTYPATLYITKCIWEVQA